MAPRRLLLLLLVALAAASSLPAAPSTTAAHEPAKPPSRELQAADPRTTVHDDDAAAALPAGACSGLIIPPRMIRTAVPAGPRAGPGAYDVTVVLRATRRRGQFQYHVVPGCFPPGSDDGGHLEEFRFIPAVLIACLVWCFTFISFFCFELLTGALRGDGDEAYSGGGGGGAVPMKSVRVDAVHADAGKVKQPRSDN
ncbi:unnamed protein product [Urochloa humidicola]